MQTIRTFRPHILNRVAVPTLLMLPFVLVLFAGFLGQLILAHAAEDPPALGASLIQLLSLIKDKAGAAAIIMVVFQILRTHEVIGILGKIGLQGKALRIFIAVTTTAGYVLTAYGTSGNLGAALIEGLFVAGGAMLIFDAFKSQAEAVADKKAETTLAAIAKKRGSLA